MGDLNLRQIGIDLFERWTAMWNLNLDLAEEIMAPRFTLHYTQAGAEVFDDLHHPQELAGIIKVWHEKKPGIKFKSEGEAVIDLSLDGGSLTGFVARPYFVCFVSEQNQLVARSGTDILKITDGRISEVWSVSSGANGRTFYR